jgi:integrase
MENTKNLTPCVLDDLLRQFITQKRALGYKYAEQEYSLKKFTAFIESRGLRGDGLLSKETILEYCARKTSESPKTQSNRISGLRQFIFFLNANGFGAYLPKLPRKRQSGYLPYVFTHDQIFSILTAADSLRRNAHYNSAEVYPVLFRVLYGCGLRVSEALGLRVRDVDLHKHTLFIEKSKFDKSRLVVMDASLAYVVSRFLGEHCKLYSGDDYVFRHRDGTRRGKGAVYRCFRELLWECGIPFKGRGHGPRLHDVRHTFCCHSLKKMSDAGIDMYCALPVLSAYLGHSGISSTERYLRLTEEIYPDVGGKVQASAAKIYPEVYMYETD